MTFGWVFYAILSAVFAAVVAIFGKIGLQNVDTTLATTVRAGIMAVFLFFVAFALGKFHNFESIQGRPLLYIILSGVAGALSWLAYFYALKNGPASAVSALDRLSVVFVFILATLFLAEKFTWLKLLGAVMITAGAIVMSL